MPTRLLALSVLSACGGGSSVGEPAGPTPTDTSTTSTSAPTITATCAPHDLNALRAVCEVTVDPPAPIEITFAPSAGGRPRTIVSAEPAASHRVTLHRMYPQTDYDWTVTAPGGLDVQGTVATGTLPKGVRLVPTSSGATTSTQDVLLFVGCGTAYAVIVDPDGQVVWYQPVSSDLPGSPPAHAVSWSDDGQVLVNVDNHRIRRYTLDGTLTLDAVQGVSPGFDHLVHHDLLGRDGWIWTVYAELYPSGGVDYVMDGIYALDETGAVVNDWSLAELHPNPIGGAAGGYWEPLFPGAIDWSHANGVFVDDAHDMYVSFFNHNAVLKLRGDPLDARFGELVWALSSPPSAMPSSFVVTDPDGLTTDLRFEHIHHAVVTESGDLQVYDNSIDVNGTRVLRFRPDPIAGQAPITASWPLGTGCPIAGSAYEMANGHLLATCATEGALYEIAPETSTVARTLTLACESTGRLGFPRGIPIDL